MIKISFFYDNLLFGFLAEFMSVIIKVGWPVDLIEWLVVTFDSSVSSYGHDQID